MREETFERLYVTHAQDLFGYLVYRTGDRALAEDLMADTFARVLRARRPFDPRKGSEKTWLYTIALNLLRDELRRRAVEARALERVAVSTEAAGSSEEGFDAVEHRDTVMRSLGQLSDEEREAIALRYGADLTVPEIAKMLREPLSTVDGRVYRALRKLRAGLT